MLIVLEGIDGSGKGTQSKLLTSHFLSSGKSCKLFSFPCYDKTDSGKLIAKYLNGSYGDLSSIPAAFPATLYANDRYEIKAEILHELATCDIVIADRYTPSNFAHQAAKFKDETDQDNFINWVKDLEYKRLNLPKPDKIVFLDIPPEITSALILKKTKRSYTDDKKDIHEKDNSYLKLVYNLYKKIAMLDGWIIINCVAANGTVRSETDISTEIISKLNI